MPIIQDDLDHNTLVEGLKVADDPRGSISPAKPAKIVDPDSRPVHAEHQHQPQHLYHHHHRRRLSEESIRTELCEGPIPDSPTPPTPERPQSQTDTSELIERFRTPAYLRSRRPSFSSDTSPLQHASMVGSYEESILRGRMSTTPSKPIEFLAQIGVLGLGKCKASLRCPPHVTLPFPAVYYSYGSNVPGRPGFEDGPSPAPGGSYRIPEKGRIQIVIKNQNKTAVKLFLVPYDLSGMEPGTKTFIRQRSYSAGPIVDGLPQEIAAADERPILRYLVHLHICCPSKGRFYMYKSIRLVFANRVPDGKVKLRNETTWPEPRFSPYKPIRATAVASIGFTIPFNFASPSDLPVDPVPFRFPSRNRMDSEASASSDATGAAMQSPDAPRRADLGGDAHWEIGRYEKLSKGDVGYGGNAFAASASGSPGEEGLLSQRLRSLGVEQRQNLQHQERWEPR
ncbi:unnamed protein product [Parascedosporium putredinis]|uniref:Atos-like conserved domain-containing protein n=1 Tax=Parascedosporium putredinis TaxID=1442378 RepID=A0A9P1H7D8_9PEZI|nr:unnamed protein product [Parascedosporium putredinis]CAI7998787.1 unnamed protein product [Parascedosporium putredinis]